VNEQTRKIRDIFLRRDFLPISKESYPLFKSYDRGELLLAEMTATVATVWASAYDALYKCIDGYLCSLWFFRETVYFEINPPVNPRRSLQDIVDILYDLSVAAGLSALTVYAVEEAQLEQYRNFEGYTVKTEYSDDHSEYAYRTADLLELSGSVNFYKRKRLKKCFETADIVLWTMTRENAGLCLEIQEAWCRSQDCAVCGSFVGCEKQALQMMMTLFDSAVYTGLILYHGERPAGYIICEKMNEKTAYLYFGKALMQDFFVYLIYMMFKEYLGGVEYMNINEDMGNKGLRQFKAHLSAHQLWRKYLCTYTK
jgi:hypothetical protein